MLLNDDLIRQAVINQNFIERQVNWPHRAPCFIPGRGVNWRWTLINSGDDMTGTAHIVAIIATAMSIAAQAQTANDPGKLFAQYVQAVNAGDKAALRDLISEEVERHTYSACTPAMSNRDCLLTYISDTVLDKHGHIDPTDSFGVDGDTLYGGLVLRSDGIRASGAERAVGIDKIKMRNNKIVGLVFLPNLQDAQTKQYLDYRRAQGMPGSRPAAVTR